MGVCGRLGGARLEVGCPVELPGYQLSYPEGQAIQVPSYRSLSPLFQISV
jgi:hypothetical protein